MVDTNAIETPTPTSDTTPVTSESIDSALGDIVKGELGEPTNPETPAPDATPAPTPTPTPGNTPAPGNDLPNIPAELLTKPPVAVVPPATEDVDPDAIDLESVDEKLRPNLRKMGDKIKGQKRDLDAVTSERDTLKEQLSKFTDGNDPFAEERTELQDTIAALKIESDPRHIEKYKAMTAPLNASLKATLESYNVENLNADDTINKAASMNARERADFLATVLPDEIQQTALVTMLPMFMQLDVVNNTKMAEIQNHAATLAALDKAATTDAETKLTELVEGAKSDALKTVGENELLLTKVPGNEEWNQKVDIMLSSVDALFATQDPKVHAEAFVRSLTAPVYKDWYVKERTYRQKLEGIISDRNIALPNISSSPSESDKPTMKLEDMTADSVSSILANSAESAMAQQ